MVLRAVRDGMVEEVKAQLGGMVSEGQELIIFQTNDL